MHIKVNTFKQVYKFKTIFLKNSKFKHSLTTLLEKIIKSTFEVKYIVNIKMQFIH